MSDIEDSVESQSLGNQPEDATDPEKVKPIKIPLFTFSSEKILTFSRN